MQHQYLLFFQLFIKLLQIITKSLQKHDLLFNHSNGDLFTCEDNMLFSRVKLSCFRAKAHLVFHWCLQLFRQRLSDRKRKSVRDNAER